MRNKQFVAVHRGGRLTKDNHHELIKWARACSEHALPLVKTGVDERLTYALYIAKKWAQENVPTGDAMKASSGAHAVAREASDPVLVAVARSVGQAVATAHMADHSLGAALYARKAAKHAGKAVGEEKAWQNEQLNQLSAEIVSLVLITLEEKEKSFKL